ncbi:MAG: hypothetical protein WC667_09005 [Sulfurimonas sp.]|jgi:hypothetical protein
MRELYSLYVQDSNVSVLCIKRNRKIFDIISSQIVDAVQLSEFLKDKDNLYLSVEIDEVVDENVDITSDIQNDEIIRKSIFKKLGKSISENNILSNYYKIFQNLHEKKTTYHIDGVIEKNYFNTLSVVDDLGKIKSSTLSKFSLLCLSNECINEESYFSIFAQGTKVTVLAVHKTVLIFTRVNSVSADDLEIHKIDMAEEISQTIFYVQQQFRDIKFSAIALSGSLAIDEVIAKNIYMTTELPVTVLYPNTFLKGMKNVQPQEYIIPIGNLFVPRSMQFLPDLLLALRQFDSVQQLLLAASVLALLVTSFLAYDGFSIYFDSLKKYETIKSHLASMTLGVNTYSLTELSTSLKNLDITEKDLQRHPSDIILALKPLIELQKPEVFNWKDKENGQELEVRFIKSFDSLAALYQFEKKFMNEFNNIDTVLGLTYSTKSDYTKMIFSTVIGLQKNRADSSAQTRKRRK